MHASSVAAAMRSALFGPAGALPQHEPLFQPHVGVAHRQTSRLAVLESICEAGY
jgi:hypothetical protein